MDEQPIDPATCTHPNGTLRQWYTGGTRFEIRDGNLDDIQTVRAIPTGGMGVTCWDCGLDVDYWPGRVPAWLKDRVDGLVADLTAERVAEQYY